MGWSAQKSSVIRASVVSSATALAPFSQKSAILCVAESGQAQPGQSKPCFWFSRSSVRAPLTTPTWSLSFDRERSTAGTPAAWSTTSVTRRSGSIRRWWSLLVSDTPQK